MKRWFNGIREWLRKKMFGGRRETRAYSISGWVRSADGTYRNGESKIYREGHTWYREDPDAAYERYPTLHAAIKQERKWSNATELFEEMSRRAAKPLIGAPGSEDGRDA